MWCWTGLTLDLTVLLQNGATALIIATSQCRTGCVQILLGEGVEVNTQNKVRAGATALVV